MALRNVWPQWKNSRIGNEAISMCGRDIPRIRILRIYRGAGRMAGEIHPEAKEFMASELV